MDTINRRFIMRRKFRLNRFYKTRRKEGKNRKNRKKGKMAKFERRGRWLNFQASKNGNNADNNDKVELSIVIGALYISILV
jgi:hypothetical protein